MKSASCGISLRAASCFVGWLGVVITTCQIVFVLHCLSSPGFGGANQNGGLPGIQFVYMDIPAIALNVLALTCLFSGLYWRSSGLLAMYISASVMIVLYNFALKVIWGFSMSTVPLLHVCIALILGLTKLYFICVVSSYYQELRSGYKDMTDSDRI